jgi:hypothetical protein
MIFSMNLKAYEVGDKKRRGTLKNCEEAIFQGNL